MKFKSLPILLALTMGFVASLPAASTNASKGAPAQATTEKKPAEKGPAKPYTLDVCIVTDNDLGSMGDEQVMVYEGQTIKFCCKPCERKFLKNPAKYLEKLTPKTK